MAEVIILILPAKSSHETPTGTGTQNSVAAEAEAGMSAAEEGTKVVAEESVSDSQGHAPLDEEHHVLFLVGHPQALGNVMLDCRPQTYGT
jgi:hypothetical protein